MQQYFKLISLVLLQLFNPITLLKSSLAKKRLRSLWLNSKGLKIAHKWILFIKFRRVYIKALG